MAGKRDNTPFKMLEKLRLLFERKEIRFLFVGGINTAVGYGTFALCIFLGLHYVAAQIISTIIGVANSYFWNKYFTFRKRDKSLSEVVRFITVYAVSFIVNLGLLYILIDILKMNEYIAGCLGLIATTLISYIGHNKFSFAGGVSK